MKFKHKIGEISKNVELYGYIGFLIIILAYIVAQFYIKSHLPEVSWTGSDWLINYEDGGFKRRGFSGSILFFIQDILKIPLNTQIFIIQFFFVTMIFYFIIRLFLLKKINWDILILLCSPLCLLFIPINIFNSGRKEIILIALVAFFAYGEANHLKKYILFIGYIVGLFLHELFYFYLPFIIAVYILKTNKINLKYLLNLFLVSTLTVGILFFFGGEINQGKTIEILKLRGIKLSELNIFTYDMAKERKEMFAAYKSYILFALELLLMIFLFFAFVKRYLPLKVKVFKIFVLMSLIWVSPLYFLGADWFRWNHIYALLLIILIILALPDNDKRKPYIEGTFNTSLLLVSILFFIVFFLHIKYDTSGNSQEKLLEFIKDKIPFI
ncbi:hypothetical protein GCM10023210_34400 [Chryseobacterium ginsengisoli]|uniref:EpsG family protein n=1 Tax=Chryseobacterium ginsengisoli TaxID=363853 RepID=A0ABP9MRH3_9FLAO